MDTYVRSGIRGPQVFPYIPGSDAAGTVEAIGAEVSTFKVPYNNPLLISHLFVHKKR